MQKNIVSNLGSVLWFALVFALAYWIGWQGTQAAGMAVVGVPIAILFVVAVLLAGRPRLIRPPGSRRVLTIKSIPQAERTTFLRRTVPWRLVQIVKLKKRFTFSRTLTLTAASTMLFGMLWYPYVDARMTEGTDSKMESMLHYDPVITTQVFARGGERVCAFHEEENRILVPLEAIPEMVRNAFIAAEDRDFYRHGGINPLAIARAVRTNYLTGSKQGGSGITQQTVKGVLLKDSSRTLSRKIQEAWLSVRVEKLMSKDEILRVYLNHISFGHNAYGVQAASQAYFGKDVKDLTLAEAAILAGLPKAPTTNSPHRNFERARVRQGYVLGRMVAAGFISQEQADAARAEEVAIISREEALNTAGSTAYYCRRVYYNLKKQWGADAIFHKGMNVYTSLDLGMQKAAESAVRRGLIDLERRIGFNGPEGHDDAFVNCSGAVSPVSDGIIEQATVAGIGAKTSVCLRGTEYPLHPEDAARVAKWSVTTGKRLAAGDLLSVQIITVTPEDKGAPPGRYAISARRTDGPEALHAAMMVTDPHTGELLAYVGGYDYNRNQWDNAYQAWRAPGSSIKPYVYACALRKGMPPDYEMVDAPLCYDTASGPWCPTNYRGPNTARQYMGRVNLRTALAQSLNSVSIQLAAGRNKYACNIEEVIDTMRDLGITSPLERVLPLSIGATSLTLWEHTYGYTSIAANGKRIPRHPWSDDAGVFIRKVTGARGNVLYEMDATPRSEWPQAIPAASAAELIYLMEGVVKSGTGKRMQELQRPVAGKTGTTNDFNDVWFMSFTNDVVMGVWVGRQVPKPIAKEATGGSVALPIALAAMKQIHPDTPARAFEMPDDAVLVRDRKTGELIPYMRGHVPDDLLSGVRFESGEDKDATVLNGH